MTFPVARRKILGALGLVTTGKVFAQLLSWSITIVVMRWLTPSDYGLSATIFAVLTLLTALFDYVLITQLVRLPGNVRRRRDAYEGFGLTIAAVSCVVMLTVGQIYGSSRDDDSIKTGMWLMSLYVFLIPLRIGPEAEVLRSMKFSVQLQITLLASIAGALTTLVSAALGAGFHALLFGPIVRELLLVIGYRLRTSLRFKPSFSPRRLRSVFRRSKPLMATELIGQAGGAAPVLIYAQYFTSTEVGYFSTATYWALVPLSRVMNVVNQVALPVFAATRREIGAVRAEHLLLPIHLMLLVTVPTYIILASMAPELVRVVLGEPWLPMAGMLTLFCLPVPLRSVLAFLAGPLQANAKDQVLVKMQLAQLACTLLGAYVAIQLPFSSLGAVHVIASTIGLAWATAVGAAALALPVEPLVKVAIRTVVIAVIAVAIVFSQKALTDQSNALVSLLLPSASFAVLFALMVAILDPVIRARIRPTHRP